MDMNNYRRRLNVENVADSYEDSTIHFINQTFEDTPLYQTVIIGLREMGARVSQTKKSTERQLLLRPLTIVEKGEYAEFRDHSWLLTEFNQDKLYPKAQVKLCNEWLKWKDENGLIHEYPCVAIGNTFDLDEGGKYMVTGQAELTILVQHNEHTSMIPLQQRFIFSDKTYKVNGIDDISEVVNDKGIVKINVELTSTRVEDDVDSGIADDTNTGWGEW